MSSALPRWPSANVRYGMTLTLREAMDSDVVARWKHSNRQARKEGSIFGGRVRSRSATAPTIRHVGRDIDHKFRPLSSDRALVGKPSGASRPLEFAQEL
jgi:hypothetical protein